MTVYLFKQANLGLKVFKSWTLNWLKKNNGYFSDIKLTPFL